MNVVPIVLKIVSTIMTMLDICVWQNKKILYMDLITAFEEKKNWDEKD